VLSGVFLAPPIDTRYCLTAGQVLSELGTPRAFCDREDSSPKYLVLPKHLGVAWAEYFHNIHIVEVSPAGRLFSQLGDLPAKQLFEVYVVERRPSPGVLATAELPDAIRGLCRASLSLRNMLLCLMHVSLVLTRLYCLTGVLPLGL
jgi:hypothetical protein